MLPVFYPPILAIVDIDCKNWTLSVIFQYWSSFCGVNTTHEIMGENI